MTFPDRLTADWIENLGNGQLVTAESQLHVEFLDEENQEKQRRGPRYALLEGPPTLVNAWLRWQMLSNEARSRGLLIRHRR